MPLTRLRPVYAGAVDLRNALAAKFGVDLPATVVYDHPTSAALTAHIGKLVAAQRPAVPAAAADEREALAVPMAAAAVLQRRVAGGGRARDAAFASDIIGIACHYSGVSSGSLFITLLIPCSSPPWGKPEDLRRPQYPL